MGSAKKCVIFSVGRWTKQGRLSSHRQPNGNVGWWRRCQHLDEAHRAKGLQSRQRDLRPKSPFWNAFGSRHGNVGYSSVEEHLLRKRGIAQWKSNCIFWLKTHMILFRKYPSLQRLLQQFWAALSCSDREQQLGVSGSTRRWPENTKERWESSRLFRDESVGYSSVIEHLYTLIRIDLWYV